MMPDNYVLFHPTVQKAFADLQNPKKTECLDICRGKTPGVLDLFYAQFPPNMHRNDFPVSFTFCLSTGREFKLNIMSYTISGDARSETLVMGFVTHDQIQNIFNGGDNDGMKLWVAAKFWPVSRTGKIYLSKVLLKAIERSKQPK